MKLRAIILSASVGLIFLALFIYTKEPAHGRDNLNLYLVLIKRLSPFVMFASCILILLTTIRLKILSIISIGLIVCSVAISYFLAERTGYSMGTTGWLSFFLSTFFIVPLGLILSILPAVASLISIFEMDRNAIIYVLISTGAILALGFGYQIGADIKPEFHILIQEIKDPRLKNERVSNIIKLSQINDDRIIPLLIELLKDKNPRIREAAAMALVGKPQKARGQALLPLLNAAKKEPDMKTKEWMIRTMGGIAPLAAQADRDKAVDLLIEILQGENSSLKGVAAESLGWIKDERAIAPLIEALPQDPFYAYNALIAITGKRFDRNPEVWKKWYNETKPPS